MIDRRYRLPGVLALVLAAVVGAYLLGRASGDPSTRPRTPSASGAPTSSPGDASTVGSPGATAAAVDQSAALPPLGTPLKAEFSDLQARANAGDAHAAMRLFRDLNRCRHLRSIEWKAGRAADDLTARKTAGMSAPQLRTYQAMLDSTEIGQREVEDRQALCKDVGDDMLDTLTANMAQAARLGDAEARACYLARGPMYDQRSLLRHPESLGAYRRQALSLVDAGLAAGDWQVVDQLRDAYEPGAQGLLAGLVGADAYQHYRYLKLYRLGAEDFRAAQIDQQLALAAGNLTSAQRDEADEWAQTTLRDKFSGNSTAGTPQGWDPCGIFDN